MKENDGSAARRKLGKKIGVVLLVFVISIGCLYMLDQKYSNANEEQTDRQSLFSKLRRRRLKKPMGRDAERILAADLNLVDIEVVSRELRQAPSDSYAGIYGIFCKVNWAAHKKDPSSVPMFRDVIQNSHKCENTRVRLPLLDIAAMARDMDETNSRQPTDIHVPKPLNVTGVVFHESRCGSTLVANTLIASNPTQHRVYSESPPPVTAFKVCGDAFELCTIDQAAMIVRDVLYMMSRTNDPSEERVFFKIQSVGSKYIHVFRHAFPDTPWIFVYREPVQVIMSHLARGYKQANCLRSLHRPPLATLQVAKRHGHYSTSDLSPEQFCAAHLATITESALSNIQQSNGKGRAVNYDTLPTSMYETILPTHMGVPIGQPHIDRILAVSEMYSKGRGNRKKEWQEDSTEKTKSASREIRDACQEFLSESYQALQGVQ
ncbi:HSPB (Heat shock 27kDa) associated protein 1 [Seminavis robusta]|uniref:HSPB (Heat shock 27kDa) associated protein 1 n=1 Tax=Seminavis robusta TaxID=568900 RepID=A0A9N8HA87_9STRA|nr:HSPB (Heat shock 27kDa) associated protein 1 [Seminavis robusta]|eukprot:Sro285_g108170.1 HSPB (Heat shock 27kDa) associated protein 1 (434) ;mRNA; r:54265-55715